MSAPETPELKSYSRWAVLVSALVGLAGPLVLLWLIGGFGVFFEQLYRIGPTVEGGGVGADWVAGNSIGWLNALISLVHAADVIMGLFILIMVFIHWASFRRLASRMRRPDERREEAAVADGGEAE